jgi:hypothetical protein
VAKSHKADDFVLVECQTTVRLTMPWTTLLDTRQSRSTSYHQRDVSSLTTLGKLLWHFPQSGNLLVFSDIIETLRMIVAEKNADELLQNGIWASYAGDGNRAKQSGVNPISKDDAKSDANQAAAHLRVLITLFITNSEFRKIMNDLGLVGRDIFATTASKAAEKARPNQDQLDQIDQEAPSKQWIGADGQRLGTNDTPDVQLKGPGGSEIRYNPKDAPGNAS